MPLPLRPRQVDLIALEDEDIDFDNGVMQALYQGDSYEIPVIITDEDGNPFNLGANWVFRAQLREEEDGPILLEFVVVIEDAALGMVRVKGLPEDTTLVPLVEGKWDFQAVNLSDPDYDVGYTQTIFRGRWKMTREVTR